VARRCKIYIQFGQCISSNVLLIFVVVPFQDRPTHRVRVYDLKGAWTLSNRNVIFGLFDGYLKAKALKRNLSSEALKGFKVEGTQTPMVRTMLTHSPPDLRRQHHLHTYSKKLSRWWENIWIRALSNLFQNMLSGVADDSAKTPKRQHYYCMS
jgi:hypothetical protein